MKKFLSLLLLGTSIAIYAGDVGDFSQTPSELLSTYFVYGKIDTTKIQAFITELKTL